jgi:hypothetical protein
MAPNDFNALCEGYENKQHAQQELLRMQTYMLLSPYMKQGSGYDSFKRQWQFGWERKQQVKIEMPSAEKMEEIRINHQRVLDTVKNKK